MPTATRKPEPIGTVWATCRLQVINVDGHWQTVTTCLWTDNAIAAEFKKLKRRGIRNVWVHSGFEPRKPLF